MFAGHFDFSRPLADTIDGVMSPKECRALLARLRETAWLPATVNSIEGRVVRTEVRNNTLAIVEDERLAAELFGRVRAHLPATIKERRLAGLKDKMRCYRYEVGQHFGLHRDQSYAGREGELSELTFMLYLNDDFEGGETEFPDLDRVIHPRTGTVLWFQHMLLHQGCRISAGTKYVLRTDVLYTDVRAHIP